MALSDSERKSLTSAVARARSLLEGEARDQLLRIYGFTPEGAPRPLKGLTLSSAERGIAEQLREWHRHLAGLTSGTNAQRDQAALRRMAEETAFTVLHRLAAIRMAEERGVLRTCLRDGLRSDGFRLYLQFAGGALGRDEEAYRVFLERVFDEIAQDLPALFDRREPRSLIFPGAGCLEQVVARLNVPELARAWQDDEAIGWVYQDFHSADERKKLREGKKAPKDSHHLAVRNQLFTPRWVVEFLTDNTLGRLWVEMTGGATAVADHCAYLYHGGPLLPVPPKDPREIRVLDPACGSGHFLLYAYDLLERIYLDAWDRHVGTSPGRTPLWSQYPDRDAFARAVPALILRHNLFGVDIDPRPIQVAALALWLRAQRSWQRIPAAERPTIERMNLVCAEPMPGDRAQLDAFAAGLQPPELGELVRALWQAMRPVGETGLLLRIDETIRRIVREARERSDGANRGTGPPLQGDLFDESPNWAGPRHDLSSLARDEAARFWTGAEERVVQALADYAAQAGEHERVLRRLFAEDAERGLALIDISRARYDVVLMNPPFGQPAEGTKDLLDADYPACGHEIYAMFFQRALEILEPHGRIGAITERDWLGQSSLRGLREQVFGSHGAVVLAADIGYGALEAKVETAAVVVDKRANLDSDAQWFRLVTTGRKESALYHAVQSVRDGQSHPYSHRSTARRFKRIRDGAYAYSMSEALLDQLAIAPSIGSAIGDVKQGTVTADDFRFLRLIWEMDMTRIGLGDKWPRFAKGGEYRPFWDDVHLTLNWETDGEEIKAFGRGRPQNTQYFGRRGVTWPLRTNLPLGPRVLPEGCAFSHKGPTLFASGHPCSYLGVLAARPFHLLLSPWLNTADASPNSISKSYEVGVIKNAGAPHPSVAQTERINGLTADAVAYVRKGQLDEDVTGETCAAFTVPPVLLTGRDLPLDQATRRRIEAREDRFAELAEITAEIDTIVADAYGFTERDRQLMDEELEPAVARFAEPAADPDDALFRTAYLTKEALPGEHLPGGLDAEVDVRCEHRRGRQTRALRDEETLCRLFALPPRRLAAIRRRLDLLRPEDLKRSAADCVSWALGLTVGRWDIRLLDHADWIPGWADPFGPLPRCPLGQLVDARGLPAAPGHLASATWLAARTDACALPLIETDSDGTPWVLAADGTRLGRAEDDAGAYPLDIAWDGILQDDALDDAAPARHLDDLYRRTSQCLELVYGAAHAEREAELAEALGTDSLRTWLRRPDGFFADHLARYSKSKRRAPIYWPLSTASGGFTLWLYYPRLCGAMLSACVNRLRANEQLLQREEAGLLAARSQGALSGEGQGRLDRIGVELRERAELREALNGLVNRGFAPHLDDGAVVNAAPLARWFRHRGWREAAQTVWDELERGEHDWSHLALWLHPEQVLQRCRTERDLAIAHGREDLYEPTPEKPRRGRRRGGNGQLALAETTEPDHG
ncbi:BREX-1 system adenine-specific DNA-methyltransferase PglX [uncultured Thiodictyon sp.]|jgi:hypothetical protein|uniref:BREX-1 system adenine-specific DNA-methyltransferase PglX n=1 Tax=uncultured Thiodictyon sp. TaxID=1846217 RepID=UPI0025EA73A8|nr:BREX-1 system adenine-specific DNA-methyltransferase PglX [uncultured Thiodictyon sp.]